MPSLVFASVVRSQAGQFCDAVSVSQINWKPNCLLINLSPFLPLPPQRSLKDRNIIKSMEQARKVPLNLNKGFKMWLIYALAFSPD